MNEVLDQVVYAFGIFPFLMLGGLSVGMSVLQREAERDMAKDVEEQADYNAELERIKNEEKTQQQLKESEQLQKQQRLRRASIESMYARSGIPLTGTPATLMAEQAGTDAQNVENLRATINTDAARGKYNEQMIRYSGRVRADNIRRQADLGLIQGFADTFFSSGFGSGAGSFFLNKSGPATRSSTSTGSSSSGTGFKLPKPKKLFGLF